MTCYFWINRNGDVWSSVILRACWRKISEDVFFFLVQRKRSVSKSHLQRSGFLLVLFAKQTKFFLKKITKTFVPYKTIQLWSIVIYSRGALLCTTPVTMIKKNKNKNPQVCSCVRVRCKWVVDCSKLQLTKTGTLTCLFCPHVGTHVWTANAVNAHSSAATSWKRADGALAWIRPRSICTDRWPCNESALTLVCTGLKKRHECRKPAGV